MADRPGDRADRVLCVRHGHRRPDPGRSRGSRFIPIDPLPLALVPDDTT